MRKHGERKRGSGTPQLITFNKIVLDVAVRLRVGFRGGSVEVAVAEAGAAVFGIEGAAGDGLDRVNGTEMKGNSGRLEKKRAQLLIGKACPFEELTPVGRVGHAFGGDGRHPADLAAGAAHAAPLAGRRPLAVAVPGQGGKREGAENRGEIGPDAKKSLGELHEIPDEQGLHLGPVFVDIKAHARDVGEKGPFQHAQRKVRVKKCRFEDRGVGGGDRMGKQAMEELDQGGGTSTFRWVLFPVTS